MIYLLILGDKTKCIKFFFQSKRIKIKTIQRMQTEISPPLLRYDAYYLLLKQVLK